LSTHYSSFSDTALHAHHANTTLNFIRPHGNNHAIGLAGKQFLNTVPQHPSALQSISLDLRPRHQLAYPIRRYRYNEPHSCLLYTPPGQPLSNCDRIAGIHSSTILADRVNIACHGAANRTSFVSTSSIWLFDGNIPDKVIPPFSDNHFPCHLDQNHPPRSVNQLDIIQPVLRILCLKFHISSSTTRNSTRPRAQPIRNKPHPSINQPTKHGKNTRRNTLPTSCHAFQ